MQIVPWHTLAAEGEAVELVHDEEAVCEAVDDAVGSVLDCVSAPLSFTSLLRADILILISLCASTTQCSSDSAANHRHYYQNDDGGYDCPCSPTSTLALNGRLIWLGLDVCGSLALAWYYRW